jgi:hypothetical protein
MAQSFDKMDTIRNSTEGEIMTVTVYTKPDCVQCNATNRALDKQGVD